MNGKTALIEEIKTAFRGVKLEDGIGLREANGIDDYKTKERLLELRQEDEKENWENVPFEDICEKYESAFSYLDAKGMRFYLPQYLIADILDKDMSYDPEWTLNCNENGQFDLFNIAQIQAVIHYLEYKMQFEIECCEADKYDQLFYKNSTVLQKWKQKLSIK